MGDGRNPGTTGLVGGHRPATAAGRSQCRVDCASARPVSGYDFANVGLAGRVQRPADLLPGQVVTVVLPAREVGVVIPAEAVVRNGDDRVVFVRNGDGVESRVITLQPLGADYLATTGVAAGEQVVVRGASVLKGITLGLGGE